jgi:DNA-binding winged helix-turn-helix (wHTH) protein
MDLMMHDEVTTLDNRDMYLLGVLAERATELIVKEGARRVFDRDSVSLRRWIGRGKV